MKLILSWILFFALFAESSDNPGWRWRRYDMPPPVQVPRRLMSGADFWRWKDTLDRHIEQSCDKPGSFQFHNQMVSNSAKRLFFSLSSGDRYRTTWNLVIDALNGKDIGSNQIKPLTKAYIHWVIFGAVGILSFCIVIVFICGLSKCWRKCCAKVFCQLWCADHPRPPIRLVAPWKKILIAFLFITFGVILLTTFSVVASVSGARAQKGMDSFQCDVYQTFSAAFFGQGSLADGSEPKWAGLQIYFDTAESLRSQQFSRDLMQHVNGEVLAMRQLLSDAQAAYSSLDVVLKDGNNRVSSRRHAYPIFKSSTLISTGIKESKDALAQVTNDVETELGPNSATANEISSHLGEATDMIARVLPHVSDGVDEYQKQTEAYNLDVDSFFWAGVGIGSVAFLVAMLGWVTYAWWIRLWMADEKPHNGCRTASAASFICYGCFGSIALIFGSLMFLILSGGSGLCKVIETDLLEQGKWQDVFHSFNVSAFDLPQVMTECVSAQGQGIFLRAIGQEASFRAVKQQLAIAKTRIDEIINEMMDTVFTDKTLVLLDQLSFYASWLFLPEVARYAADGFPLPASAAKTGIQEKRIEIPCLQNLFPECNGNVDSIEIRGLEDLQNDINTLIRKDDVIFCLTPALCVASGGHAVSTIDDPVVQNAISTAADPSSLEALFQLAVDKIEIRKSSFFRCNEIPCGVDKYAPHPVTPTSYVAQMLAKVYTPLSDLRSMEFGATLLLPITDTLTILGDNNCHFFYNAAHRLRGSTCKVLLPFLSMMSLSLVMFWVCGMVLMIMTFCLWHYAHNSLFVKRDFSGVKPDDLIHDYGDLDGDLLKAPEERPQV